MTMRGTTSKGFIAQGLWGEPAPMFLGQRQFILHTVMPWVYCVPVTEVQVRSLGPGEPPEGCSTQDPVPTPTVQLSVRILPSQSLQSLLEALL